MKKVLIIEDDEDLRNIMLDKFKKENFGILSATNGEEGLEISLKEKPDLILLDLIMPKMDGTTMLKKLRNDEWGKTAKVILLTNLTPTGNNDFQDVTDYLVKADWKLQDIVDLVKNKLK